MTQELSEKFRLGSLICTIMVVYRHSLNLEAFLGGPVAGSYCTFFESGVSKLTEIAVPYFFLLSGYLFFSHSYMKLDSYQRMLKKKVRTLFIPFIFWNLVGILPLMLAGQFVFELNPLLYIRDILRSDWNGVLWYVRDIMILMLLVPLYGWIFSYNKKWLYFLIFIALFTYWIPVDCSYLSSEGLLFFFLGGVIRDMDKIIAWRCPVWAVVSFTALWLFSCFFYPCFWPIHKYNTLVGVFLLWQLLNYIPIAWKRIFLRAASYSFFIYVTHLYLVKAMKVTWAKYYFGNEAMAMIAYIIIPVITVVISFFIGKYWHKYMPHSFLFVTGGRG